MIRFLRLAATWLALLLVASSPVSAQPWTLASGGITTAGVDCSAGTSCIVAVDLRNVPSFGVYLDVGTSGTFNWEATINGSDWFAVSDDVNASSTATVDGAYFFTNPGYRQFRVRASAISGAATVVIHRGVTGLRSTATLSGAAQGDGAVQDGANSSIEATVLDLTNTNPLTVAITDANGDQITSFGGGTQYTHADADATPTGTVALGFDGSNVRALATDASGNLQVEFPTAQAVTGSGDFTVVNSGTFAVQAAQSGTWTVQPGNTANTTPWLTSIAQGGNTAAVNASGQLSVTCANCSGSGASAVDDAVFTVASDSGAPIMGLADETTPDSVGEGDVGVLRMTTARILKTTLTDATGAALGATSPIPVQISDGSTFASLATDSTHDSAISSSGPASLLEAVSDMSANTAVADGDAVRQIADLLGRSISAGPCDRGARVSSVTTVTDGSSTSAIAAGGAGVHIEVWDVLIANTSATPVTVDIRDGTAGTIIATLPVPADTAGVVHRFAVPLTSSANTAIAVDPSAAASAIIATLSGCKVK